LETWETWNVVENKKYDQKKDQSRVTAMALNSCTMIDCNTGKAGANNNKQNVGL
jgi:hypothetical protein